MKRVFFLLFTMFLLNGCAESVALLGTTAGGSSGKIVQSSFNQTLSYGIKKQTGKSPLGHFLAYAEKHNPEKTKNTCISFIDKTNSEICAMLKKQISLTKVKIINNKKHDKSLKDSSLPIQSKIAKRSKIKYLD
jgi:hypothetical protein